MGKPDMVVCRGSALWLMKPTTLSLLLLLNSLASVPALATTWLVDGVSVDDITESTRFYDTGKGYYWPSSKLKPELEKAYEANGNSYSFLGAWNTAAYISSSGGAFNITQVEGLQQDAKTCWYNVSANVLTYWQTTYGFFYTGSESLATGYNYDKKYLVDFGGTQSLAVGKVMYDNWENEGGSLGMAASWYLSGDTSWANLKAEAVAGGYFDEYFGDATGVKNVFFGHRAGRGELSADNINLTSVGHAFADAFGFADDGMAEEGRLGYLSICSNSGGSHALTCYGYKTDDSGTIKSLLVTNSDDMEYGLIELFLKVEEGDAYLYTDAEFTKRWEYASVDWYLDAISYIDTPEVLRQLRAEYTSADNALLWNGGNNSWSANYAEQENAEEMPTASTGWDIYAEADSAAGYFHSFYDEKRGVQFDDHAGSHQSITVSGKVKAAAVSISADEYQYAFTAEAGASLETARLAKSGSEMAEFSDLSITASQGTTLSGGELRLHRVLLTTPTVQIAPHGRLGLDSSTVTGSVTVGDHGTLHLYAAGATINSDLVLQDGAIVFFDITAANTGNAMMTLGGNLDLQGLCKFEMNESSLVDEQSYRLIEFTNGWEDSELLSQISLGSGYLSFADGILTYTYTALSNLIWDSSATGTWDSSTWDGESTPGAASAHVTFATDATITASGVLTPGEINVSADKTVKILNDGTASFRGVRDVKLAENAALTTEISLAGRDISLSEGAELTFEVGTENKISEIDMAAGSKLVLGGGAQHIIYGAGLLDGDINLLENNKLTLALHESKELDGKVTTANGSTMIFANSGSAQGITYTLTQGTSAISGDIEVGQEGDAGSVMLSTPGDTSAVYRLAESGILQLTGGSATTPASFTGNVTGSGTLEVAEGATVNIAVAENTLPISISTALLVKGTATIGADSSWTAANNTMIPNTTGSALTTSITDSVEVDGGALTVWVDPTRAADYGAPLAMESLKLSNGASFTVQGSFSTNENSLDAVQVEIGALHVGAGSNQLELHCKSRESWIKPVTGARVSVGELSGSGDITFLADNLHDATMLVISLEDAEAFSGDVTVLSEVKQGSVNPNRLHVAALELAQSTTISGCVHVQGDNKSGSAFVSKEDYVYHDFQHRAMLGLGADATIGGLDGNDSAYLYAGRLGNAEIKASLVDSGRTVQVGETEKALYVADTQAEISGVQSRIDLEKHTLVLETGSSSYEFQGTVLGGVSLEKHGTGTQVFSGNVEHFSGSVNVQEGTLAFTGVQNKLSVENLSVSAGATLESSATIVAQGNVDFRASHIAALQQALSLDASEVVLSGVATVQGHLDLSQAATLNMEAVLDMAEHSLNLGTDPLALGLTLGGTLPEVGSSFDLLLFTNVSSLTFAEQIQEAGEWQASDYFTSEYITEATRLVFDGSNVGLLYAVNVPEPATATLSLLALSALAMRRRRK